MKEAERVLNVISSQINSMDFMEQILMNMSFTKVMNVSWIIYQNPRLLH